MAINFSPVTQKIWKIKTVMAIYTMLLGGDFAQKFVVILTSDYKWIHS